MDVFWVFAVLAVLLVPLALLLRAVVERPTAPAAG